MSEQEPLDELMSNHNHSEHEAMARAMAESPLALRVRELLVGSEPGKLPPVPSPRCLPPKKAQ